MSQRKPRLLLCLVCSLLIPGISWGTPPAQAHRYLIHLDSIEPGATTITADLQDKTRQKIPKLLRKRPSKHHVVLAEMIPTQGASQRLRRPELSDNQLIVVAMNAAGKEIAREIVLDPRLVRAEDFDLSGQISSSSTFYTDKGSLSVALPDDLAIKRIQIYQPTWNGTDFDLTALGETSLP